MLTKYKGDSENSMAHWDRTIARIDALSENIYSADRVPLDLILSGESWTEASRAEFQGRLQADGKERKIEIKNVVYQPDVFAASKRSARWGRHDLDTWDVCYMLLENYDEIAHDEL